MKVITVDEITQKIDRASVAFGFFDGIHLGHQDIINRMAAEEGINKVVLTFLDHPESVIRGQDNNISYITTNVQKEALLSAMGVDYIVYIHFTKEVMALSPEDFIKKYLLAKFDLKKISVGFNNRFGRNGAGDSETLKVFGRTYGFDVEVAEAVVIDGVVVSSSLIRRLVAGGEVDKAAKYLGRYYDIEEQIIIGKQLGRTLGVPTINMAVQKNTLVPNSGVYLSRMTYKGEKFDSITNVGNNPTFVNHPYRIETHVFDFHQDLYGEYAGIEFIKKIRGEKKFQGIDELKNQIYNDMDCAKKIIQSAEN
mgnify:CR=1 FL=1|jgi:riboflavin kinase/FMN adenylyltransferase